MKLKLFTFYISLLIANVSFAQSYNYKTYPSYDSIINSLRLGYKLNQDRPGIYYRLARKPDGWHLLELDYSVNGNTHAKDWLYWSGGDVSFHPIPVSKGKSAEWVPLEYDYDRENFLFQPYWGYDEWWNDVIQVFEHKPLDDSLTYALGRAYSAKAGSYLCYNDTLGNNSGQLKSFSQADIVAFSLNDRKAIAYFKKTMQLNPRFETKVGNIFTKYCNEYLFAYYLLVECGQKEEAKKFLADSLYDPFMLSAAKNILNSCPENSILVTSGDNDTYPLVYVQEKMGFRKDVIICNYNLSGTASYINYLRNDKSLGLTLSERRYAKIETGIIYIDSLTRGEPLENVIIDLSDSTRLIHGIYPFITSKNVFFSYSSVDKVSGKNRLSVVHLPFQKNYLLPADIVLLDIIYTNGINANICFSSSCYSDMYKPFSHYMQVRGLVYEFTGTSYQNLDTLSLVQGLNIPATTSLLQKQFSYNFETRDSSNLEIIINTYKNLYIKSINALITEKNNSKASELANEYFQTFPVLFFKYGITEMQLIKQLLKLHDEANINSVCNNLLKEGNRYLAGLKYQAKPDNEESLTDWLEISSEIKNLNMAGLEKEIKNNASLLYASLLHYYK